MKKCIISIMRYFQLRLLIDWRVRSRHICKQVPQVWQAVDFLGQMSQCWHWRSHSLREQGVCGEEKKKIWYLSHCFYYQYIFIFWLFQKVAALLRLSIFETSSGICFSWISLEKPTLAHHFFSMFLKVCILSRRSAATLSWIWYKSFSFHLSRKATAHRPSDSVASMLA